MRQLCGCNSFFLENEKKILCAIKMYLTPLHPFTTSRKRFAASTLSLKECLVIRLSKHFCVSLRGMYCMLNPMWLSG